MEKQIIYKTDMNREKILNFCTKIADWSDKNEISLFLNRYKINCKKEFKNKCIKGLIISELVILAFFIIISISIRENFLINNFKNIYQFFLLPIIAYGIIGAWYIFNKNTIILSLEKMLNDNKRNIFVSNVFILQKHSNEKIGNSVESGYIETLIFKEENNLKNETVIIGKNKQGFIWDEIQENKKYKFYAMSEKLILGIMSLE